MNPRRRYSLDDVHKMRTKARLALRDVMRSTPATRSLESACSGVSRPAQIATLRALAAVPEYVYADEPYVVGVGTGYALVVYVGGWEQRRVPTVLVSLETLSVHPPVRGGLYGMVSRLFRDAVQNPVTLTTDSGLRKCEAVTTRAPTPPWWTWVLVDDGETPLNDELKSKAGETYQGIRHVPFEMRPSKRIEDDAFCRKNAPWFITIDEWKAE